MRRKRLSADLRPQAEKEMPEYIHVEHTRVFPDSVTVAAFSGATWRFIPIPDWVQRRRPKAVLRWISWRCRHHYQEKRGRLFLFGEICGYRIVYPDYSILLDTSGKFREQRTGTFTPGRGSLAIRRKPWISIFSSAFASGRMRGSNS